MLLPLFLLFFLEVAGVENCLRHEQDMEGIKRAMVFHFSASQLQLCSCL